MYSYKSFCTIIIIIGTFAGLIAAIIVITVLAVVAAIVISITIICVCQKQKKGT